MASGLSLYDILGITQDASADAVRKAYKLKALETHPDRLPAGTGAAEIRAAQASFNDVKTAFDVLSDPAKRHVYDNGLNYMRLHVTFDEVQNKLAQERLSRERAEWARQTQLRAQERMREQIYASQKRYEESVEEAKRRYQEKVQAIEKEHCLDHGTEFQTESDLLEPSSPSDGLADEFLQDLRKMNPEWEMRRREAMRRKAERMRAGDRMNREGIRL
ncbi:DnaJ-domain-containing protein [Laetiporus sulphureus 93-53]|uniref:DnaJ-domain-containing protein n=1 Tax=Laetiporus sulphureus 93-53 TaxID=1314785 RepID=A0A165GAY1_9APHY|nr:DnaJ-domain-containing protein [Laetiporus sulphureus 93-53]KZT10091.1 DnaJ-domain-containing protein [Laetiporus sulphureus 93-53]